MCTKCLKIGKYPLALAGNMDETSVFFDRVPNKSFPKKVSKSFTVRTSGCETVRTSGCEKKQVIVVLTIDVSPPMIIFPVKIDRTFKDLTVLDNLCIVTQEKAWMNERLMMVWYEKI